MLETLSEPQSQLILDALQKHQSASFPELMLYTGLNSEELVLQLEKLRSLKAIQREELNWQPAFGINERHLSRLFTCAGALAQGADF